MALAADRVPLRHPLTPLVYRLVGKRRETEDTVTLSLEPTSEATAPARPGQFNMLTAFGAGEIAISISNDPAAGEPLEHTVRAVGAVSRALCQAGPGQLIGVRGPFGTSWGVEDLGSCDVLVVAGGIGLAPLRGAVRSLLERSRSKSGACRLAVAIGTRNPEQLLFEDEIPNWRLAGAHVLVTVDAARPGWTGPVGVVSELLGRLPLNLASTRALVCGPEIMIRFTARRLLALGMPRGAIRVSLERNMQCGVGLCGHCQLGPWLICRDGPVVDYSELAEGLLSVHER